MLMLIVRTRDTSGKHVINISKINVAMHVTLAKQETDPMPMFLLDDIYQRCHCRTWKSLLPVVVSSVFKTVSFLYQVQVKPLNQDDDRDDLSFKEIGKFSSYHFKSLLKLRLPLFWHIFAHSHIVFLVKMYWKVRDV